jgi:hypothetical protein
MPKKPKPLVYYSMVLTEQSYDTVVDRFLFSVRSLRRYNSSVPVRLVITGRGLNAQDRKRMSELAVTVIRTRPYVQEIGEYLPAGWAKAMALFPLVHKWLNLQYVVDEEFDQLLYLDNDTYFLHDVVELTENSTTADVIAREEPYSKYSWIGPDPTYLDEEALLRLTRNEKVAYVPPFNCGVVLFKRPAALWLAENLDAFMDYMLRFSIWMCKNPNDSTHPLAAEMKYVEVARKRGLHRRPPRRKSLPFLGRNRWIVEERALWLTLGRSRFSVRYFSRERVAQGSEVVLLRSWRNRPHLIHYFGSNSVPFSKWIDEFEARGARIKR